MALSKEQILVQLENLIQKVKLQTLDSADIECRVFEPQVHGQPYIVEVSKDRFIRRVPVEYRAAQNIKVNQPDPRLMRELRTAFMAVRRLAQRHR